jgi:polysaccharide biosynthesis protein PslH
MGKHILFLTPQLPYPLHQGTTLRNFGLISGLAARGHEVSLLSFIEAEQPRLEDTPLPGICVRAQTIAAPEWRAKQRIRVLITGHADMARRRWSDGFLAALDQMLTGESFDVVHIEGIEMAPYLGLLRKRLTGACLIYDAHNAEYALQKRIASQDVRIPKRWPAAVYSLIQTARLTRLETETCKAVDHVIAVSQTDAKLLGKLRHSTPISVIPNAVLVDDYQADAWPEADIPRPSLVFTGKMDFRPNVDAVLWFAEEILPRITAQIPDAQFVVVGQKPHARLDGLRARLDVTLTGWVEDIRPYLKAAAVYVAPLRMGSGTRFKLLEAMAMERAVVSTHIGAEGLGVKEGDHMLLANDPEAFAASVVSLLRDTDRRAAMGRRARELVQAQYDWHAIIPDVEAIYG